MRMGRKEVMGQVASVSPTFSVARWEIIVPET